MSSVGFGGRGWRWRTITGGEDQAQRAGPNGGPPQVGEWNERDERSVRREPRCAAGEHKSMARWLCVDIVLVCRSGGGYTSIMDVDKQEYRMSSKSLDQLVGRASYSNG